MKSLILLHGALGSKAELLPLKEILSGHFELHLLEFEGHGHTPLKRSFTIADFANQLGSYIDDHKLAPVDVFGYSMGGYVALYLASLNPDLVDRIITLGTKFDWTPESAKKEVQKLNPEILAGKVPRFAEYLATLHGEDNWKNLVRLTAGLMLSLGNSNLLSDRFSKIPNTCFIGRGSLDNMVSQDETAKAATEISNATEFQLVDTPHPLPKVNCDLLALKIIDFLK